MTCIVGLEYEDGVIIGGDSTATTGNLVQLSTTPKVFKLGDMIVGYTWSFRMGQIIQYSKDVPKIKSKKANYEYLVDDFVPFIRNILKEAGWLKIENSQEEGGQFLVGIRGQIFQISSDFSVLGIKDGFNAVGNGSPYALGALKIIHDEMQSAGFEDLIEAEFAVRKALETAAHYSGNVSPPFVFVTLENQEG